MYNGLDEVRVAYLTVDPLIALKEKLCSSWYWIYQKSNLYENQTLQPLIFPGEIWYWKILPHRKRLNHSEILRFIDHLAFLFLKSNSSWCHSTRLDLRKAFLWFGYTPRCLRHFFCWETDAVAGDIFFCAGSELRQARYSPAYCLSFPE